MFVLRQRNTQPSARAAARDRKLGAAAVSCPGGANVRSAGDVATERLTALIKRIRLATTKNGLGQEEFSRRWRDAVAGAASAPEAARPVRLTVSVAARDVAADQKYDGIALEWFTGEEHLLRYQTWLRTAGGREQGRLLGEAVDLAASPVVVSDEQVVRGADWLERRWQDGAPKLKQLAIATRAGGLTLPQFLELWRSRAGTIGSVPIPEAFRGLAYVQNHPRPTAGLDWAYDAVNEVYFDDAESLLARIEYFERELKDRGEDDLISANWFLAVREEPLELPTK
jgi:hypothetical protein